MTTITLPSYVTTPHDLAAHLMDGDAVDLGRSLDDILDDHKRLTDEEEEVRLVLVGFGALEDGDVTTDRAALLAMLLPASLL